MLEKQEIVPLYDYVHLQKGVRNNLLTKDLQINKFRTQENGKFASWDDIVTTYEIDKYSLLRQRQMPKLNDKHIFPHMIPKMKVKYATQVLSHSVANFMDIILTLNQGKVHSLLTNKITSVCIMKKLLIRIINEYNVKLNKHKVI